MSAAADRASSARPASRSRCLGGSVFRGRSA